MGLNDELQYAVSPSIEKYDCGGSRFTNIVKISFLSGLLFGFSLALNTCYRPQTDISLPIEQQQRDQDQQDNKKELGPGLPTGQMYACLDSKITVYPYDP